MNNETSSQQSDSKGVTREVASIQNIQETIYVEISPEEAGNEEIDKVPGSGSEVNVQKEPNQRYDARKDHKDGVISNQKEVMLG